VVRVQAEFAADGAGVRLWGAIEVPAIHGSAIYSEYVGEGIISSMDDTGEVVARLIAETVLSARQMIARARESLSSTTVDWHALLRDAITSREFVTAVIMQRSEFSGYMAVARANTEAEAAARITDMQRIAGVAYVSPEIEGIDDWMPKNLRPLARELFERMHSSRVN